jgi:gliding motility-associated-like protein
MMASALSATGRWWLVLLLFCGLWGAVALSQAHAQTGEVQAVAPAQGSVVAEPTDSVRVEFAGAVEIPPGQDLVDVYGSRSGRISGTGRPTGDTLLYVPDEPFRPGEQVTVVLSEDLQVGGTPIGAPYVWQFTVRTEYGTGIFEPEPPVQRPQALARAGAEAEAPPVKVGGVSIPSAVVSADFNEDQRADVAVVHQPSDTVQVRYGSTLSNASLISMPGAVTLAQGDVNGDGRPDLVTVHSFQDSLGILLNEPSGWSISRVPTGSRPTDVEIADVTGDGAPDLVVTPFGGSGSVVHVNDGTGGFSEGQPTVGSAALTSVVARDVDRDGDLDLLVTSAAEEAILWLKNEGAGTFSVGAGRQSLPFVPAVLAARDVFGTQGGTVGDGWVDLVVAGQDQDRVLGFANRGTGEFAFDRQDIASPSSPARTVGLADVDPEQESTYDLDLFSTHSPQDTVQVAGNRDNDEFIPDRFVKTAFPPVGGAALDLDRDEDQDYVVADQSGGRLQVLRNQGGRPGLGIVSRTQVAFGEVCVGDDSTATVSVTNLTNRPLVVRALSVPDGFALVSSVPDTLAPDQSRALEIAFAPTQRGLYGGSLVLELAEETGTAMGTQGVSINLSGTGVEAAIAAIPDTLSFGEVYAGSTATRQTTLENDGNIDAQVDTVLGLDGAAFAVEQMPALIPDRGGRTATFRFDPPEPNRAYVDTAAVITSGNCGADTTKVVLRGSTAPLKADLVAEALDIVDGPDDTVRATERRGVVCEFSNQGDTTSGPFSLAVLRDGNRVQTRSYDSLATGATVRAEAVQVSFPTPGTARLACVVDADAEVDERREDNNRVERTIEVLAPPAPDLVAESLDLVGEVPSPLRVTDSVAVACTISNAGSEGAGSFLVGIARNGARVQEETVDSLSVGATVQTDTTTVPLVAAGTVTIRCTADAEGEVDERGRTTNNVVERTLTVQPPPAPDLVAEDLRSVGRSADNVQIDDTLGVVCDYANQGSADAGPFQVRVSRGGTTVESQTVEGLGVGAAAQTPTISIAFPQEGRTEIRCEVDPEEQVDERGRLDNNTAVLTLTVQRPDQLSVAPNPFTPNGDGINDTVRFKVSEFGLRQPVLRIYTFEGRELRTIDQLQAGELRWNGTDSGGDGQPPGVYLYVVEDGGETVSSGHITLAR